MSSFFRIWISPEIVLDRKFSVEIQIQKKKIERLTSAHPQTIVRPWNAPPETPRLNKENSHEKDHP